MQQLPTVGCFRMTSYANDENDEGNESKGSRSIQIAKWNYGHAGTQSIITEDRIEAR